LENDLLISIRTRPDPKKCVLVFDLVHDDDCESDCIVISNYTTAKEGYLIDGYSDEEEALLDKFHESDFDGGNMMESMYELPSGKTKDEIIDGICALGFGYMPGFLKDCKSL
jgi:hypothetical protein